MNKFNLDIPKIGYIILLKSNNDWAGKAIEKAQLNRLFKPEQAQYIHSAMSLGGQHILEVSPPITKVVDIRKKYKNRYIKIVRYRNEEYERKGRYKVAIWSATQCNLKYDWFGVLRFRIKLFWQWKSRPFCSENCMWALKKEFEKEYIWGNLKPKDCMPAHFCNDVYFEKVWEGKVI